MKAADLAVRRPPRPPRPRFILALFRTTFTLAALAICQSTSPSSLSPSQTRTNACSYRIDAFDYHVLLLNETALAATLSLYQSIDRPSTVMYQTHPPHFPTTSDLGICTQLPTDARLRPNTHEPVLTGTFKPFTKGMGNAKKRTALVIGKTANQAIGMLVPWGKQRLNAVSYTHLTLPTKRIV